MWKGSKQITRRSMIIYTMMYFVLYVVGGILILCALLNDEIFITFDMSQPDEGLLWVADVLAFAAGLGMWIAAEFVVNKSLNEQYKKRWIMPIFEKNWKLTAYESDPRTLRLASDFALCSDAFLQKVDSVEMNDYAVGYFKGYKCFFMDLQSVKKDNSNFKGQIFGIQLENKKFDKRITLRPCSKHHPHAFDSLPVMNDIKFHAAYSFFDPISGRDIGPSRKRASQIEDKCFSGSVDGWKKIQLMDKEEISSACFFTHEIAEFLLNSQYAYTGISLYKDMIFLFFSENAGNSYDVFEFRKSDIFKSDELIHQRVQKEFGGCMNMLIDCINVLNINAVPNASEAQIKQNAASEVSSSPKMTLQERNAALESRNAELESEYAKLLARNAELEAINSNLEMNINTPDGQADFLNNELETAPTMKGTAFPSIDH